jgi:MFS transporter, AAHS family, 4-hydroxybenzoate transporter
MSGSVKDGLTAAQIMDAAPVSGLQIRAITLCVLVSLLDGFDTQALAFVAPAILRDWGMSQFSLGIIFSATLLGTAIGASFFGVLADRVGRKHLIVWTTLAFALLSGACAFATNFEQLLTLRFLAGVGLGGVIPNMIALASEYAPARLRATITVVTLWGFPMGAVLGGLASGPLIAAFGWPSVFILGGVLPLALAPILLFMLPESLRFLAADPNKHDKATALLRKIAPTQAHLLRADAADSDVKKGEVLALFRPDLAALTILVSIAIFLSLFLTYLLVSWVPTLLTSSGMTQSQGILGAVALNLGGIFGSFLMSRWIDTSSRPLLILGGGYVVSAFFMVLIGQLTGSPVMALSLLATCGFFHIGAQMSMTAFTSGQFPVLLRGTGIGFVQGFGRIGSLIGPFAAGALLQAGVTAEQMFQFAFLPGALTALSLFALAALRRGGAKTPS